MNLRRHLQSLQIKQTSGREFSVTSLEFNKRTTRVLGCDLRELLRIYT